MYQWHTSDTIRTAFQSYHRFLNPSHLDQKASFYQGGNPQWAKCWVYVETFLISCIAPNLQKRVHQTKPLCEDMGFGEFCHRFFLCQANSANSWAFVSASTGVENLLFQSFARQRFGPVTPWWCDSSSTVIPNRATPGNNAVDVASCSDLLFGMSLTSVSQITKYHLHRHRRKQAPKIVISDPCNTLCNIHKVVIIAGSLGIKSKRPQLNFDTLPRRTAPSNTYVCLYIYIYLIHRYFIKTLLTHQS